MTSSSLVRNSAGKEGGAISFEETSSGTVTKSSFVNNTAAQTGRAMRIYKSQFTLANSLFDNNTAEEGGAISLQYSSITIGNSSFNENKASDGGAISLRHNRPECLPFILEVLFIYLHHPLRVPEVMIQKYFKQYLTKKHQVSDDHLITIKGKTFFPSSLKGMENRLSLVAKDYILHSDMPTQNIFISYYLFSNILSFPGTQY